MITADVFLSRLREIFYDLTEDDVRVISEKQFTDGTYVFRTLTTVQSYDILSTLKYNEEISKDDFISYIDEGSFDTPADVIFNMPLFSREQDMYRIKRREEEFKENLEESLYKCNRCNRPATSTTRQTRSGDEGVTVFVTCDFCNITTRR